MILRSLAASYQQPRNLDTYREHFASIEKEGRLEFKWVQNGEEVNKVNWTEQYFFLKDTVLYSSTDKAGSENSETATRQVDLDQVLSVKTAQSVQARTIIVLDTQQGCLYLHAPDEEDNRDWLFCFHTAVLNLLLSEESLSGSENITPGGNSTNGHGISGIWGNYTGEYGVGTTSPAGTINRQAIGARSRSGDGADHVGPPSSRFWSFSEEEPGARAVRPAGGHLRSHAFSDSPASVAPLPSSASVQKSSEAAPAPAISAADGLQRQHQMQPSMSPRSYSVVSGGMETVPADDTGSERPPRSGGIGRALKSQNASENSADSNSATAGSLRTFLQGPPDVPVVDRYLATQDPGNNYQQQQAGDNTDNDLSRIDTRVFPGNRISIPTPSLSPPSSGLVSSDAAEASRDKDNSGLPPLYTAGSFTGRNSPSDPSPSRSLDQISGASPGSGRNGLFQRKSSVSSVSTKRVHMPPVELASESSLSNINAPLSPTGGSRVGERGSQTLAVPPSVAAPAKRYVPPHMRGGAPEPDFMANSDGEARGRGESESSSDGIVRRSSEFNDDGNEGMALFDMDNSARSRDDHSQVPEDPTFGRFCDQGHRNSMEDFDVAIKSCRASPQIGFYAVYDGHCGTRVAQLAHEKVHEYAFEEEGFGEWPDRTMDAVSRALERVEQDHFQVANEEIINSNGNDLPEASGSRAADAGSCALIVLVHYPVQGAEAADQIAVANIGDSRAILFHGKHIHVLSDEHTPGRASEQERIKECGGWVTSEKELSLEKFHRMDPSCRHRAAKRAVVETWRVNGELAVSRALGDVYLKKPHQDAYKNWFFPQNHPGQASASRVYEFKNSLVTAEPEWKAVVLEDLLIENNGVSQSAADSTSVQDEQKARRAAPSFMIIACDGLWDVVTNEEAVQLCCQCESPQQASRALVQDALRMGTSDNITVQVVALKPWVSPDVN